MLSPASSHRICKAAWAAPALVARASKSVGSALRNLLRMRDIRRLGAAMSRAGASRPGRPRPSRVLEAEEAVHPPTAILPPEQEGDSRAQAIGPCARRSPWRRPPRPPVRSALAARLRAHRPRVGPDPPVRHPRRRSSPATGGRRHIFHRHDPATPAPDGGRARGRLSRRPSDPCGRAHSSGARRSPGTRSAAPRRPHRSDDRARRAPCRRLTRDHRERRWAVLWLRGRGEPACGPRRQLARHRLDQEAGLAVLGPGAAALEEVALRWLLEALRLPAGSAGGVVTGATMANFTALAAARHALLKRAGWDVEAQGLFGAPALTVVVGEEVHVSLLKALGLLGLGRDRVVRVPTDSQGRIRADLLPSLDERTIVCLQAGNVNTGASDPVGTITRVAQRARAWVHVDGAFGLWAAAAPARAALVAGVEEAESWALDAHKWLNVPYDSGIALCRDPAALQGAMATTAAYLVRGQGREPDAYTPELSRRARGVEIWAALAALGRSGLADLVERCCGHATRFAHGLRAAGYEVLNEVTLNQVLVSFGDDAATRAVIAAVQADGTCWCGGTVWHGQAAMRISISSWATTADDVEQSLAAMIRLARRGVP